MRTIKFKRSKVVAIALLFIMLCLVQHMYLTIVYDTVEMIGEPFTRPKMEVNMCRRKSPSDSKCKLYPVQSDKSVPVSFQLYPYKELIDRHGNRLEQGGHYSPINCQPSQKVAIIIPYRDREEHLRILLNNLHPFLRKQNVDYMIIVVEQLPGSKFNRGMIKNIGFVEALKFCDFDCFFFHDVDMIPDDYGNVYQCGNQPRHHARNIARWNKKPPYKGSFGGVVSISTEHFIKVNGYPNSYFEWGAEDDELGQRILLRNMNISTYPFDLSTYKEPKHAKGSAYISCWIFNMNWRQRVARDGLNALFYTVDKIEHKPLYTHIYVSIDVDVVAEAYKGNIYIGGGYEIPLPSVLVY